MLPFLQPYCSIGRRLFSARCLEVLAVFMDVRILDSVCDRLVVFGVVGFLIFGEKVSGWYQYLASCDTLLGFLCIYYRSDLCVMLAVVLARSLLCNPSLVLSSCLASVLSVSLRIVVQVHVGFQSQCVLYPQHFHYGVFPFHRDWPRSF